MLKLYNAEYIFWASVTYIMYDGQNNFTWDIVPKFCQYTLCIDKQQHMA